MKNVNPLANAIRLAMLFGSITAVSISVPTFAEETADDEEDIETVVVTGSRIERTDYETVSPTTITQGETITNLGYTNLGDALNNIPSFGNPGNNTEGDQGSQGVGQNFVNFYGMGSQRTLTLVNGRRFVSTNPLQGGGAGSGLQVDLNMIPVQLIDRVDTIGVGGAPIYGADAIAGTVNIILKDRYEGFDMQYSNGISERDDLQEKKLSLIMGSNFDSDKGNAFIAIDYSTKEGALEADRDHLAQGWQFREPCSGGAPVANGAGESAFSQNDCIYSRVLAPSGHANLVGSGGLVTTFPFALPNVGAGALADGNFYQFGSDGSLQPYNIGLPTANAVWSIGGEGIFLPDVTNLFTPIDRLILNSVVNYEISDNVRTFGEFTYGNTNATELANQPYYQSGLFGEESYALTMNVNNPFISDATRTQLAGLGVTDDFYLQRSSTDLLPSNNGVDNEGSLWRMVSGFEGEFDLLDREVSWDVSYNIGKSDSVSQRAAVFTDRFFFALDAVENSAGEIVCRVNDDPSSRPTDPAAGFGTSTSNAVYDECAPLNLFGNGAPSAAALDYITGVVQAKSETQQEVVAANLVFPLFELPAGDLDVAAGISHRKESASFQPDAAYRANTTRSGTFGTIDGGYQVDEFYAEFVAPVVDESMGIPGLDTLSIEGAYRVMDHSNAGTDNAWTLGFKYQPIGGVTLAYNATRSVRSPSIRELFQPVVETGSFVTDPCDVDNVNAAADPALRAANCAADGIDTTSFQSLAANASVQGLSGGNDELNNEIANASALSLSYVPDFVSGLTVGMDYVQIDLEDSIEVFTLTSLMNACYDSATFPNSFCDQFSRQSDGQLPSTNAFKSGYLNAGDRNFAGLNYKANFTTELPMGLGNLLLNTNIFRPIKNEITPIDTTFYNNGEPGNSHLQGSFSLGWEKEAFGLLMNTRYIGKAIINNDDQREYVADDPATPENEEVKITRNILDIQEQFLVDMGVWYNYKDMARVQLNVNNLTDELPERAAIASGNDFVYDNVGRYYRLGVSVKF